MKPAAILETILYADDVEAAGAFYQNILGLERIAGAPGRHVFFRCGNQVLLVFNPETTTAQVPTGRTPVPPHGAAGAGHICFAATAQEMDAWRERLVSAGVAIEAEFEWPQGGRSIYFRDPDGNSVEFAEPRIWGLS
jgi:catechol 2,3-dioxygenase-like lactoylglutathione lyase family enzyme